MFAGCTVSTNIGNQQTSQHLHWDVHAGKRLRNEEGSDFGVAGSLAKDCPGFQVLFDDEKVFIG